MITRPSFSATAATTHTAADHVTQPQDHVMTTETPEGTRRTTESGNGNDRVRRCITGSEEILMIQGIGIVAYAKYNLFGKMCSFYWSLCRDPYDYTYLNYGK